MSASTRLLFDVCKASGRLRPGQVVECEAGAALDGSAQVAGRLLNGVPGPARYYARVLPVPRVYADRTVQALTVLGHPNVVSPVGVGGADGEVYIVQELPEGDPLTAWIERARSTAQPLRLREVEQVLRQVATALRHAHQAQIRHGALGSAQVRVARQPAGDLHVQVMDFGIFPLLAAHSPTLPVHEWHQLSPEQAERPSEATPASDLFSLGVLLTELLTGYALVPPGRTTPWRTLAVARPPDVRATIARERPETPDGVLDLVAGLLRAKPSERAPASAMDVTRLLPRLSWEPRVVPPRSDVSESPRESLPTHPSPTPDRPATLAPSRSFVVSGTSFRKPVPDSVAATPTPTPLTRQPAVTLLDDLTLNDTSIAPPQEDMEQTVHDLNDGVESRSWFAPEQTVVRPSAPVSDNTSPETEFLKLPPRDEHSETGVLHRDRTVTNQRSGPAPRSLLRTEGTALLVRPEQLAAERAETTASDGTPSLAPRPLTPSPVYAVPAPLLAPPLQIEKTMPDTVIPELRGLPPADGPHAQRDPRARTLPPPRTASPSAPPPEPVGAHPIWLALVIIAAGAVLAFIVWGLLNS